MLYLDGDAKMVAKPATCYVAMPFGDREGRNFDAVYAHVVKPVIESLGINCIRSDEFPLVGVSQENILSAVVKSDIMIADVSVANPNVMYQLGVRHVASCGLTILMSDEPYLPSNTSNIAGMLRYSQSIEGFQDLRTKLAAAVKEGMRQKGSRSPIHRLFPELQPTISTEPCVFIGHGRNALWARVQIYLERELGVATVGYESESRVGSSIITVLEDMLTRASFAVLVLTAEDETKSGSMRARQNVVHEAGLFQGRLGFTRAIVLKQEGTENFSNIAGLQYVSFTEGHIEQTFYELRRVLDREGVIR